MEILGRIVLRTIIVLIVAYLLPGIYVGTVFIGLIIAVVLALLNSIIKPILVILTLPITVITLGIFLLIINGLMVMLASFLIDGFYVSGLLWAVIFSLLVSFFSSLLGVNKITRKK
jgi:putative membrane protein